MFTKLDLYIIRKFFVTFFFMITLLTAIAIVFDISEKLEDFIAKQAPFEAIAYDYYVNFIPYITSLIGPLFLFLSVIFFTSKLARNSEIIVILAAGVSFRRLLRPYLFCASIFVIIALIMSNLVTPKANKKRLAFEEIYIRNKFRNNDRNIHLQINQNTYVYMHSFNVDLNMGQNFSIEQFDDGELKYKLISDNVRWDSLSGQWMITNYTERRIDGLTENLTHGAKKDTVLNFHPSEFKRRENYMESMDYFELQDFIDEQRFKGGAGVVFYELEKHYRMAIPFSIIILTVIAVAVSSRKTRGGTGLNLVFGIGVGALYVMFTKFFSVGATNSGMHPFFAAWIPNILYGILALYLLKKAPK